MQVLLQLILTCNIYFGCVIDEVLSFSKSYTTRAFAINVPYHEHNVVASIIDSNNEFKR